jgi:class 3 adenylate cyclase/ketosteroid isomerase-like protein
MAENRRACASCGTANEEDARFCEGCGASLARVCATCGVEASATARFCRGCGAPLGGQVAQPPAAADVGPVRKTVTVMFADLAGSTTFEEQVDAETAREVMGRYHELLRTVAQRHRAGVTKYIGDGFMAVWGVPAIGPDDAVHAVDAAVDLQEHFVELAAQVMESHRVELALRVAVNTGEVVVGAGDADLVGDALNVGARLEAECPRGRVVVGEETWRATRGRYNYESLGEVQVKGRSAPVAVYQWAGRQSEGADAAPFVGRADEFRRLQAVLDDATSARAARLVTVIGDPGVGKSRLAAEFTAAQGDARVIAARCVVEGTIALAPMVEVLRARDLETDLPAELSDRERLLRDLNGLAAGIAGSVEENFWALRRFVEVLATAGPVVLVVDDIQWADTLLLDFIEHLVEWVQEVPVLILAMARPELRETRPDLVSVSRWVSEAIHLSGLDPGATAELAAKVLGAARLPDDLVRRLPSSTGGNPLFVRELIGMLAHDGVLVEQPVGWRLTIDVDAIAIPPTIHALLASRVERLDAADRRVLEIAAVAGSDFSLAAVRALSESGAPGIELSLKRLRRLELVEPSGAYIGDEPVWRFHHVLIRDVAYRRLLKSDRADLHERLADWVAAGGASVAFDSDEMIARHLEAAHTYRLELGAAGDHTADLALRAARHYVASARRALDRDELVSAGTQAARGAALAGADEAVHSELLLIGCEAFMSAGDVAAGAPLVDELERIAGDPLAPWATCYRCQFVIYTNPELLLDVDARLQGAIDEFGRRRDHAGLAKAHRVRASARSRLGRIGDCEADLFEALIAARQSGDHRQITAALGAAPGAALWGPSPVPKAGGRCLDVVRMQRMTTAAPSLEATSLRCLAVLELLRGRPDKARAMLGDARQVVADLGLRHGLMETELFAGIIESMDGDPVAAEPHFRTALEGLDALGVGADAGQAAALLAKSLLAQGRLDEADRYATQSERLAGRNLKTAIAWRAVRAEIFSERGQHAEATALAREAATVAAGTDLVLDHADACMALSRVLAAAGDTAASRAVREDAGRLYAAKEVADAIGRTAAPSQPAASTPAPPPAATSRLPLINRASATADVFCQAVQDHDVERAVEVFAETFVYEDRRRLSGEPIGLTREAMLQAGERLLQSYPNSEWRTLAVRGARLELRFHRMWDDAGNETTNLGLTEIDSEGAVTYQGRFDGDDFESAYLELERRYYDGEGAAFAENGRAVTEAPLAMNNNDFDRLFGELAVPGLEVETRSRRGFATRSAEQLRDGFIELDNMVSAKRTWMAALHWVSPSCSVARLERTAVGQDGEQYAWSMLLVSQHAHGRLVSMCEFDVEDEEAAFAYAEEHMRPATSRVAVTNDSCASVTAVVDAIRAQDVERALSVFAEDFIYDDHRRLSVTSIVGLDAMRGALVQVFAQYTHFDYRVIAVRGRYLHMAWHRSSDDHGNESVGYYVNESTPEGLVGYQGRFDEDDFDGAYRELERRYYAGEGAAFAEGGAVATESMMAMNEGDLERAFGDSLFAPGMHYENRSVSAFPNRSAGEVRESFEELNAMVAATRTWLSVVRWLSPTVGIGRFEREAIGHDGEKFTWTWLNVNEVSNGRIVSMCQFGMEDEDAAFAYAQERVHATKSRLALRNRASEIGDAALEALNAGNFDAVMATYSSHLVYDDRRRISGEPIDSLKGARAAVERIRQQYSHFEGRALAVRGERLALSSGRWCDDAGNETTDLVLIEIDDNGLITYQARFDEADFTTAYREFEQRYFSGEGAPFADAGNLGTEFMVCLNSGDLDRAFHEFTVPGLRLENRSRSAFPDRSIADFRRSIEALDEMVVSSRMWNSVLRCVSPTCSVAQQVREAVGQDGESYRWTRLIVCDVRDGKFTSMCQFEADDEDAALAYAQERVRESESQLALSNRAMATIEAGWRAMHARDPEALLAIYAEPFVYDDRRRFTGYEVLDRDAMRHAIENVFAQYRQFDWRALAVRGERLVLGRSRWWDEAGNETAYLHVFETGDDNLVVNDLRFDEDDFEAAYRELEQRYYADEGSPFAEGGLAVCETPLAMARGDHEMLSSRLLSADLRFDNRSRSPFPGRSTGGLLDRLAELHTLVASTRMWVSALRWLSSRWCVVRLERESVGHHGELYAWTRMIASEQRGGQLVSFAEFEPDDEEAAFAYAEERARATRSRFAVSNVASETAEAAWRAMQRGDVDRVVAAYADHFVYNDRRQIRSDAITDSASLRRATQQMLERYSDVEWRTLAVRGDSSHLAWVRWSNADGYETTYLHLSETDDAARIVYDARFDENDFDSAYRLLEERYYAPMGPAFIRNGRAGTDFMLAVNAGDLDTMFGDFIHPEMVVVNRSRSFMPDRSAAEFRASLEELDAMVTFSRSWSSVLLLLSPNIALTRQEREATAGDGEDFRWSRILVSDMRDGKFVSFCEFDVEDEEAALAYAEDLLRTSTSRLTVANQATAATAALIAAMNASAVDRAVEHLSDRFSYDDHRRLTGDPVSGLEGARAGIERILQQYNHFDVRSLAVRGERLHLFRNTWRNDAGYEVTYLHVQEIDGSGHIFYEGRFDEDDFETAYRELHRRYYTGEGQAFADSGTTITEFEIAMGNGDLDKLFNQLTAPGFQLENRSRAFFGDRSAAEFRATEEDLSALVSANRTWRSAVCWLSPAVSVSRFERVAVGLGGENYSWTGIAVAEVRDGQLTHVRLSDLEDEQSAFNYAEQQVQATASRLALNNRACAVAHGMTAALRAHDVDAAMRCCRDDLVYDDRRRLSGEPIRGDVEFRAAWERVLQQYSNFDMRILAVRGENLMLNRTRWSDAAGNESVYLHVFHVGDDGRLMYSARFDDVDFESAYRELERRYYADHAEFATVGNSMTDGLMAYNDGEFDVWWGSLNNPELRFENRSRSLFPDRSSDEVGQGLEELASMVSWSRAWCSVMHWLTPNICVCRYEREAGGADGEQYSWTRILVGEIDDGRAKWVCQFDLDDEEAAFAYAEERAGTVASRLAVDNSAARSSQTLARRMTAGDISAILDCFADDFQYGDRRKLSGDPIQGRADLRTAAQRILGQFSTFESNVIAVRGERLALDRALWANDAGYETIQLCVNEVDEDGRISVQMRFDADDFDSACRELDRRFYSGEGLDFASCGHVETEFTTALNTDDFDRALGDLTTSDFLLQNRSRSLFGTRSPAEFRASEEELRAMVSSVRSWHAAVHWVSPTVSVARNRREAVGTDGDRYEWTRLYVTDFRSSRIASVCEFDLVDEDAAFAYAEERAGAISNRLALDNRACEAVRRIVDAMRSQDIDATVAHYSSEFFYNDRRRLTGGPVSGSTELRAAFARIAQQYNHSQWRTLAVRGERLSLHQSRWFDDAGNETEYLHLFEIGDDGLIIRECRFDVDDFDGAYRELERRFFSGEGSAGSAVGTLSTEWTAALNRGDIDRAFTEFTVPDATFENRSHIAFPDPSIADPADSFRALDASLASVRTWASAVFHVAARWWIVRIEREAVGLDGERYSWTWLDVTEIREGRCTSTCLFDLADENAAFAYAEERAREAAPDRLPMTNRAKRAWDAMERHGATWNLDEVAGCFSPSLVYDDRRRMTGFPIPDMRAALDRIADDYSSVDMRSLAIRGERLHLGWSRYANDSTYESSSFWVHEVDDDGKIVYLCRFDEDDFNSAYRALEERYYAGEGAAFAAAGSVYDEYTLAMDHNDFDRLASELSTADFRLENRSRSVLGDRTGAELATSFKDFSSMVASTRTWTSTICWLSPTVAIARFERHAFGSDGEHYAWSGIDVAEVRDSRLSSVCLFELDDEDSAFAYAEERVRETSSRLAVSNRASRAGEASLRAMNAGDADGFTAFYSDDFVYDDRRRLGGNPFPGMREAIGRVLAQYTTFEGEVLAVRGERLSLAWTRWSNDAGFQTSYLLVQELDDAGLFTYQGRFDEDDFVGAYNELTRRYCAGEGAAHADGSAAVAAYLNAYTDGDFDRLFGELTTPDFHMENRSASAFSDRNTDELRAALEDLNATMTSVRTWDSVECWISPTCCVGRNERRGVGADGEQFAWTRIYVGEIADGRVARACEFDIDDEDAAFAYAEEQVRRAPGPS